MYIYFFIQASEDLILQDILTRLGSFSSRVLPREPSDPNQPIRVRHGLILNALIDISSNEEANFADVTLNVWEYLVSIYSIHRLFHVVDSWN